MCLGISTGRKRRLVLLYSKPVLFDYTIRWCQVHFRLYGQANKRIRWMPRQLKAMKDVVACDKPRGAG